MSDNKADPLLPCPFCGSEKIESLVNLDFIACQDCGASLEDVEPSARTLWNTRSALAAPQPAAPNPNNLLRGVERESIIEACARVADERAVKLRIKAKACALPSKQSYFAQSLEARVIADAIRALAGKEAGR